jgi:hypothetical protein
MPFYAPPYRIIHIYKIQLTSTERKKEAKINNSALFTAYKKSKQNVFLCPSCKFYIISFRIVDL